MKKILVSLWVALITLSSCTESATIVVPPSENSAEGSGGALVDTSAEGSSGEGASEEPSTSEPSSESSATPSAETSATPTPEPSTEASPSPSPSVGPEAFDSTCQEFVSDGNAFCRSLNATLDDCGTCTRGDPTTRTESTTLCASEDITNMRSYSITERQALYAARSASCSVSTSTARSAGDSMSAGCYVLIENHTSSLPSGKTAISATCGVVDFSPTYDCNDFIDTDTCGGTGSIWETTRTPFRSEGK